MPGTWNIWDDSGMIESEDGAANNLSEQEARQYLKGDSRVVKPESVGSCYAVNAAADYILDHDGPIHVARIK